jgi:Tfp pilus assembly protein PilF/stage V sporulation protein SpoVS
MQHTLKKLPYFLCYLVAFVLGMKQMREPDIWWQLLTGRWMLENGEITRSDMFSFTMEGTKWVNVKWLYEVIIASLERGMGPEGVMLLQAVVNVAILWAVFQTIKYIGKQLGSPTSGLGSIVAALLLLIVVEYRMAGRPEMVSHLMCALYIWYLWKNPELGWKQMILPVALQCLWANMHEGYPVGIVILGTYVAGSLLAWLIQKEKSYLQTAGRAAIMTGAAAVAILLNPNGIQLWKQPFEIYRQVQVNKYTTELYNWMQPDYWTIQSKIYIVLLLVGILFWIVRMIQAKKQNDGRLFTPQAISYLLLLVVLGYLSLGANRNIIFAAIAVAPTLAVMLGWIIQQSGLGDKRFYTLLSKNSWLIGSAMALALYVGVVNNSYYKATESHNRYGLQIDPLDNPVGAAQFIKQHGIKGKAFSDYFSSSYLLWALYPDFKSYIDLRDLDIFSKQFFDDYFELHNSPAKFDTLKKKYDFNYIVLSTSQLNTIQQRLYWGEGYNMIYVDPVSVVFLKMTPENEHINMNVQIQKLFSWPEAPEAPGWAAGLTMLFNPAYHEEAERTEEYTPLVAARYYNSIGNHPLLIKLLLPAINNFEHNPEAMTLMGSAYVGMLKMATTQQESQRKVDSAFYFLNEAQKIDPDYPQLYVAKGNLYMNMGKFSDAERELRTYVKMKPEDDFMQYQYGVCNYYVYINDKTPEALDKIIKSMKESLALNAENKRTYLYIAYAEMAKGNKAEARKNLEKATTIGAKYIVQEEEMIKVLRAQTGL